MYLNLRVEIGPALRPEEFPTTEHVELGVEEVVSLILQTRFGFAKAEVTSVGHRSPEEPLLDTDESPYYSDERWKRG